MDPEIQALLERWKTPSHMVEDIFRVNDPLTGQLKPMEMPAIHSKIMNQGPLAGDINSHRCILKCRQGGFSYLELTENILLASRIPNANIKYVAVNENHAVEWIAKGAYICDNARTWPNGEKIINLKKHNALRLKFDNGSTIEGYPADDKAVRGGTALKVTMDEFAWMIKTADMQERLLTAIRPQLSQGGAMSILSTPRTTKDKFWGIYTGRNGYKKYYVPVFYGNFDLTKPLTEQDIKLNIPWQSVEMLEKERVEDLPDLMNFKQERLCVPLDARYSFIPETLYDKCVDTNLEAINERKNHNMLVMGIDFARKKDLTFVTVCELTENRMTLRHVEVITGGWPEQGRKIINMAKLFNIDRIYCDATGVGDVIIGYIREDDFMGNRLVPVLFSNSTKEHMSLNLKNMMLQGQVKLYSHNLLRNHVLGVQIKHTETTTKYSGKEGKIRGGEAVARDDGFFSLCLCGLAFANSKIQFVAFTAPGLYH